VAISGVVSAWMVIGGGVIGAVAGYSSEKRRARSDKPSAPSEGPDR
jgi:hypothetical protein